MDWKKEHPKYNYSTLDDTQILQIQSPWTLWIQWQKEAHTVQKYTNEIALATSDSKGNVSVRMLLLKHSSPEKGFCWFSNRNSEKGQQISKNPQSEFLWFVKEHQRQVRVRGTITELDIQEVKNYANSRPWKSQISALISHQSRPIQSKQELLTLYNDALTLYRDNHDKIPINPEWTGYSLAPHRFEFWQGSSSRLHDRIIFKLDKKSSKNNLDSTNSTWKKQRLQP